MTRRRALFLLGLAASVAIGVAIRLHTREAVLQNGRVRPLDSDSAYHLRRARFAAAHFPRTILFDPLMNFPEGGVGIWPPLFDLTLGLPARLAHGAGADAGQLERGAAWVPVVMGAGSILLAGLLARMLYGAGAGVGAAVFLAVSPGHVLWTQYAHTDQHAAESLFGLAALLAYLWSRAQPARTAAGAAPTEGNATDVRSSSWREALAGAALAAAVLAWQGAIFWGAVFALALVCESLLTGRSVLRAAALTLGLPAILTAAGTAAWLGWIRPPLTYVSFGWFQPLFLAALCGGSVLAALAARAIRGRANRREVLLSAGLAAACAAATLPFAPGLFAGLVNGIGYVAGTTHEVAGAGGYVSYPRDWLKGIFETRPLLQDGPGLAWRQLSAAFFLAPAAIAVWGRRAARGADAGVEIALAIWGLVTVFMALSQRLNVYYAAPLAALTAIEAARFVGARVSGPARNAVAAGVFLLLALPMWPGLKDELATPHVPGSDLFDTLERMREDLPHPIAAYDAGLLGPPPFPGALAEASSVIAPWSMGHFLLYEAELPVAANNFGYGFLDSIRFFLASSEEDALEVASRRRARWIVVTDLAARMNDYASYLGKPALLREEAGGMSPTPAYFSTMQSRLYDFDGKGAELPGLDVPPLSRIRLRFASRSAIRRGDRWLARWKVFEILPPGTP